MRTFLFIFLIHVVGVHSQSVYKPQGCSASTGPNASTIVLQHSESRYHLLTAKWSEIELLPGVFSFDELKNKINLVKSYNKKYALAVGMGGPGSPSWLIDSFHVPFLDYKFRGTTPYRLPLWWDSTVQSRIKIMVDAVGNEFQNDTALVLVYITQMTANGNEGHLQYINMDSMRAYGFTVDKWINAAKQTAYYFANAFPAKALAFEIHDIENSSIIPTTIISDLYNDPKLHNRIGAALWWLSGKTTYQQGLLSFLKTFTGDKYAQMIAHSGQPDRFADSTITTAFAQAKELNVRYIELWYEEYNNHTIDNLLHDFNVWVDSTFIITSVNEKQLKTPDMYYLYQNYPNPFNPSTMISYQLPINSHVTLKVYDAIGREVATLVNEVKEAGYHSATFDGSKISSGVYFVRLQSDGKQMMKKILLLK